MGMKVKIKLNEKGIVELLKSEGVQADLKRRAENVAEAAGPGNEADVWIGKDRARGSIRTATAEAKRAEANDRTLTRAVDAARR